MINVDRAADELRIYVNGSLVSEGILDISSLTGNVICSQDLQLGERNGTTQKCGLDDFAIYPFVLTDEQITNLVGAQQSPLDILRQLEPATGEFKIIDVNYEANEVQIAFSTVEGRNYSVYGGESLEGVESWSEVSDADLVGDGGEVIFTYPLTPESAGKFFFQVRQD